MASTGFTIVGAGATVNTGGSAWSNPGNITADDGMGSSVSPLPRHAPRRRGIHTTARSTMDAPHKAGHDAKKGGCA